LEKYFSEKENNLKKNRQNKKDKMKMTYKKLHKKAQQHEPIKTPQKSTAA
jgi:hypothetical protein